MGIGDGLAIHIWWGKTAFMMIPRGDYLAPLVTGQATLKNLWSML